MLGVRLTKYQQIHPDIPPAAQQCLQFCLHIDWNLYSTFKLRTFCSTWSSSQLNGQTINPVVGQSLIRTQHFTNALSHCIDTVVISTTWYIISLSQNTRNIISVKCKLKRGNTGVSVVIWGGWENIFIPLKHPIRIPIMQLVTVSISIRPWRVLLLSYAGRKLLP